MQSELDDPNTNVEASAHIYIDVDVNVDVEASDNVNVKVDVDAEAAAEPKPEANAKPEVNADIEPEVKADIETEVKAEPEQVSLIESVTDSIESVVEPEAPVLNEVKTEITNQPMAYELLLKIVRSRLPSHITTASITGKLVQIISDSVKFLATVKTMSGHEKKQLVIQAIKDVIIERVSVADSYKFLSLVDAIGDPMIDELVNLGYNTYLFVKSKLSSIRCCNVKPQEVEIPKEKIIELSKFVDTNLQRPFTQAKVIKLMVQALKYMQSSANRKYYGSAKKDVVLRVIRIVIEQSDKLKNSDRLELTDILDLIGDDFIDTAVAFGKDVKTFKA